METKNFSIKESIITSWRILQAHSRLVFSIVLTIFAVEVAIKIVEKTLGYSGIGLTTIIVLSAASMVCSVGATMIALRLMEHTPATYSNIIPPWKILWRVLVGGLLVLCILLIPILIGGFFGAALFFELAADSFNFSEGVFVGQIPWGVLIVIGIFSFIAITVALYLSLRLMFGQYAIIEGAHIKESLRKSWKLTEGKVGKLFLFLVVILVLNIMGAIPFMLGLLVTVPLTSLAMAYAYITFKHHHHSS